MKVALGLKAHSGWAAMVALGRRASEIQIVDRRRIELVEKGAFWAKQPYHAAEGLSPSKARDVVSRGIDSARRLAVREVGAAVERLGEEKHRVAAVGVLVTDPMPDWSVEEILAVHFRMHKAEGVLFRDALARAARSCRLRVVAIPEKSLEEHAQKKLAAPVASLRESLASLGKSVGAPWGKDQKEAALAAMIALRTRA